MPSEKAFPVFPVGPAGKRELKRELVRSTDPAATIAAFQKSKSIDHMIALAFNTRTKDPTRNLANDQKELTRDADREAKADTQTGGSNERSLESLDTDAVLQFLSHLGVRRADVYKRIADTLMKQLEEQIRQTQDQEPLLQLLKSAWPYATSIAEFRPVVGTVLRQLGEQTPRPVLTALAERDSASGNLKHPEIFKPLPPLLKRLVYETDWEARVKASIDDKSPIAFLQEANTTLLLQSIQAHMEAYLTDHILTQTADKPFLSSARERRIPTLQRRAKAPNSQDVTSMHTSTALLSIRDILCDSTSGTTYVYRPKLICAVLSTLIARHGMSDAEFLGGAQHLHCTLAADLLLSTGGRLPKAYTYLVMLARILDDCVQEGNLNDHNLAKIQAALRQIYQPDDGTDEQEENKKKDLKTNKTAANSMKRQVQNIISAAIDALKESDPQHLFLNPVTDAIAPGYSKVIKKPMCIHIMERKLERGQYQDIGQFDNDVRLMFRNCVLYNQGTQGAWFRGEAHRQEKVFQEEIYPQARRLYQKEVAKRVANSEGDGRKRSAEDGPEIKPLPAASKKRKKEAKDEHIPSMPALAAMLLADPFVVRVVLARALRELRRTVTAGNALPLCHPGLPSMLQLLHMARWSKQVCAVGGRKYFIPDPGLSFDEENKDPGTVVPQASLRRYVPLLLRLLLEAELDKRVAMGGDLYDAYRSAPELHPSVLDHEWEASDGMLQVVAALVQGSLVHLCLPGNSNESSLAVTIPKFGVAIGRLSASLRSDKGFFLSFISAITRHKTKLNKGTRDMIIDMWLTWLQRPGKKRGNMISATHECMIQLLIDWSSLGNQVLPRGDILPIATRIVEAVNKSEKDRKRWFGAMWREAPNAFASIHQRYETLLYGINEEKIFQWKDSVGITGSVDNIEDTAEQTENMSTGPMNESIEVDKSTHDITLEAKGGKEHHTAAADMECTKENSPEDALTQEQSSPSTDTMEVDQ